MFLSSIEGNTQKLDGGAMFGNAPRAMWQKWIEPDDLGRIPLNCRCFLIEFKDRKILFETGVGAFFEPKLADRYGIQNSDKHMLLDSLQKHGLKHTDITDIILSHLHFDHAGGLFPSFAEIEAGNKDILFPNANFYVGEEAFQRNKNPHPRDRASFLPQLPDLLEKSGRLILVKDADTFFDGHLSFRLSHGHTPGQLLGIFKGNNEQMIFCGDLVPGSHWVHIPITMGYDRYAEKVIDEKALLYKEMDLDKTIFCFTHDPFMSAGKITMNEKKRFQVDDEFKTLKKRAI
ncbi:MAG: MBL fold metallo-hydrolase [Bdellovibrionota bacterium]|nr:MBL fold metallo-hydrolase [Bdellovibrionota bacterium]